MKQVNGIYTYNPDLSDWETDIINAIQDKLPMIFPTKVPALAKEKQYIDDTWVIKHSVRRFKDQSVRTAPQVFAALNILNSQPYRLNKDILRITNMMEDLNRPVGSSVVHRLNRIKTMDAFCGIFYFKYTMDFRGRIYARSVLITPQGDSFSKAVIDHSVSKELGRSGVQALGIHYANQSGYDKHSYVERIKWAMDQGYKLATRIQAARGDWMTIQPLLTEYDNYEQYTAAMDWYRCISSEDPTMYRSSIVCHQDATNSGFQFGAALLKDNIAAEHVNITTTKSATETPADLYGEMAKNVIALIPDHPEWIQAVTRKFCKKPIMVTGYGAGKAVVEADILVYMIEEGIDLDFNDIKEQFFVALDATVGSMRLITKAMQAHAKAITDEDVDTIEWYAPDGFKVYHQYRDNSERKVQVGKISAIRARRKGEIDPLGDKMVGAVPPNFIHSMDAQMLRYAAIDAKSSNIAFCPIHDSFGTHAADYWKLHEVLKEAFIKTMEYDWYGDFCKRNNVRETLKPIGTYSTSEARKAAYIFS